MSRRPDTVAARLAALAVALVLVAACATPRGAPGALPDVAAGERPASDTDEAGLWMMADRLERDLETSGRVVTDPALQDYVRSVVCGLIPGRCGAVRVYVVQTPYFNASMAPNGALQVWTGLLLRTENEAQLAWVLGHEIGHYLRRHTVQQWRDLKTKANAALVFSVLTAGAGVGILGLLGQVAALGSALAFSRDNEREADEIGVELMGRAGYDPREAPRIWEALEEERKAAEHSRPFVFFATHPSSEERIQTLRDLADRSGGGGAVERQRFLDATLRYRPLWLRDELGLREFKGSQVVLDHLRAGGAGRGELDFFQGELFGLRGADDDASRAVTAYEEALATGAAPPEAYRSLGLVLMKTGARERARDAFRRYLEVRPDADDREMIRAYLGTLP